MFVVPMDGLNSDIGTVYGLSCKDLLKGLAPKQEISVKVPKDFFLMRYYPRKFIRIFYCLTYFARVLHTHVRADVFYLYVSA